MGGLRSEGREPGARRRKLAGYLKAANELRQSYQQSYSSGWGNRERQVTEPYDEQAPGAWPDAAMVRSGDEEMILFPSYARRHIKSKASRSDVRDTNGTGDAEFWRKQWEQYEDDNAIVDVDIRGWVYSPHRGAMNRKQRIFVGLARQLVGIPAPSGYESSQTGSAASSRNPSPQGLRQRADAKSSQRIDEIASKEAESIMKKGESEANVASRGGFSEQPNKASDADSVDMPENRGRSQMASSRPGQQSPGNTDSPGRDSPVNSIKRRESWVQPANMSPAELATANAHLMARLKPFLSNPLANTPISAFFYNESVSRQRTIMTNPYGHFAIRAALDFVPTHVRILASENLSVTERVLITEPKGVSVISDIDDTIKHSAISAGAREIFRNAFIRDLADLTIEGVKEWYIRLAKMGVKFHYVSNSPWQLYPVLTKFFSLAGLPPGSFHLKQYSGMLQGIFEPVAERKKGTLDKIASDFPERRFILVGDSGEADLEVYTQFVQENPGRVLGVYIRDVTIPQTQGFFDSSMGPLTGDRISNNDDNMQDFEEQERKEREARNGDVKEEKPPRLPPRRPTEPAAPQRHQMDPPMGKLVDFSNGEEPHRLSESPSNMRTAPDGISEVTASPKRNSIASIASAKKPAPTPPKKPTALRSGSSETKQKPGEAPSSRSSTPVRKPVPAPPPPRRSAPHTGQPTTSLSPQTDSSTQEQSQSYASSAREKLMSAYNQLPPASAHIPGSNRPASQTSRPNNSQTSQPAPRSSSAAPSPPTQPGKPAPPPPPPRRGLTSYPAAAASYAGSGREETWRRRWARAKEVLDSKGVVLRSWRVGEDVAEECVRVVEEVQRGLNEKESWGK
ncbi:hypothetical protein BDY21DRAFT_280251 [Lineolata rhizophorae]|uniref:Phosphatidate phosphatase APP1 catalytic domain-containing protein n=1 Tax=Lineolata rhizophorae TaxID=578093 RepID=A0A6A6P937_9PEZI|nr:hypothetical protein BDY21DRAFT_280251 [Lineolata rhizophorae]